MSSQFIKIPLPLTNHSSKIRVKRRKNVFYQGVPVATKQEKIDNDCYFEWQISYDLKEKKEGFAKIHEKSFNQVKIVDQEGKFTGRWLYELSDFLVEGLKKRFIDFAYVEKLLKEVQEEKKFIEDELGVIRTSPTEYKFGKYKFLKGTIEHPLLIYEIRDLVLKIEIIIKEKQKALGIQPMLYLCIPFALVEEFAEIKGQVAESKQEATYLITPNNFSVVVEMLKIFALLSKKHQRDVVNILTTVLGEKENIC